MCVYLCVCLCVCLYVCLCLLIFVDFRAKVSQFFKRNSKPTDATEGSSDVSVKGSSSESTMGTLLFVE